MKRRDEEKSDEKRSKERTTTAATWERGEDGLEEDVAVAGEAEALLAPPGGKPLIIGWRLIVVVVVGNRPSFPSVFAGEEEEEALAAMGRLTVSSIRDESEEQKSCLREDNRLASLMSDSLCTSRRSIVIN